MAKHYVVMHVTEQTAKLIEDCKTLHNRNHPSVAILRPGRDYYLSVIAKYYLEH